MRNQLIGSAEGLRVTGIPNRRLLRTTAAVRALEETDGTATAWDLERLLWDLDDETGVHPEDLFDLAAEQGRQVRILAPQDGRLSTFDVEFDKPAPAHDEAEDKPVLAHDDAEDKPVTAHDDAEDKPVTAHDDAEDKA